MASFARTLRIARTALPRQSATFTPITSIRSKSGYPNAAGDQSYPSYPDTTDPNDARRGKNLRGDQVEGPGNPEDFKNPNMVMEDGSSSQGKTHALNDGEASIVPKPIQRIVPEAVERALPNAIHNTGDSKSTGMGETHAAKGGEDSYVPKGAQKAVPESLERALPDSIHNTENTNSSFASSTNKDLNESVEAHAEGVKSEAKAKASSWGIGETHALDGGKDSIVPLPIQKIVPEFVERMLPNSIHNTGDAAKTTGIGETHAAKGGEDSIVPKAAQKAVPESVERALPNKIHNTKD